MTLRTIARLRHQFWGKVPNREERRAKIETLLLEARRQYNERSQRKEIDPSKYSNWLCFVVDGQVVCEKAFVNMLGLADNRGAVSKVWRDEVRALTGKNYFEKLFCIIIIIYS